MNLDFKTKQVLLRVDFNVPLNSSNEITDDSRMTAALPTIKTILEQGASLILMSHRGRPQKKKRDDGSIDTEKFTMEYLVDHLSELLEREVLFADIMKREETASAASKLKSGQVLLLENTRFDPGEKTGDEGFAQWLASLADIYVNDAFGTAHRAHASTATVAQYFDKNHKALGFLIEKELKEADHLLQNPSRPFTAIIGGAKVSDKIELLKKLIGQVDELLIGGGMAYTFIKAKGGSIGTSICEHDKLDLALELLEQAGKKGTHLHLPEDSVTADDFKEDAKSRLCQSNEIPEDWMGLDIGPEARKEYRNVILKSKTVFWNGPMGVFEFDAFSAGTKSVAGAVADATRKGAYSSIGGGDSVAAIHKFDKAEEVSFMSTGGGAMLKLLEGANLPGIEAIKS